MARAPLRAAIRQLLRLVSPREDGGLTDGQLLERFTRHRDEAAFETLMWRHGPMVLRTCQRVLRHPQDAEDAFQASFLVLCRKAGAISSRDSVGGWLYRVAYRIALRAGASAARHAAEGADMRGVPALEAAPGPGTEDLRGVLDQELDRLPEKYRLPLVLHYLEGKTVEQVAAELGWPRGTVSGRLARAKQVLRPRLARRRVIASVLLAGACAGPSATEACPATLLDATLRATSAFHAGEPSVPTGSSARAVTLARAALRGMFLTRLKLAAVGILVMLGVIAVGAGFVARPVPATSGTAPAAAPEASEAAQAGDQPVGAPDGARRLSVSGLVVGPEGTPISGARVDLREWVVWRRQSGATDILASTVTDAQGRFAFRDVTAPTFADESVMRLHPWDVVARAEGRGVAWQHVTPKARKSPVKLTLARERVIEGRLLEPGGSPVAGALVQAVAVAPLRHAPVTLWTTTDAVLNLNWSQISLATASDTGGRFVLRGLPPEMRFNLSITKAGFVEHSCLVATTDRAQSNVLSLESSPTSKPRAEPVLTGAPTVTLQRARQVRGRVVLADTGRPAPGALLSVYMGGGSASGVTADAEGRFTLDGLPPGSWRLEAIPTRADPEYVATSVTLDAAADVRRPEQNIRLPRGTPVSGRVVDAESRRGIAGVCVSYETGGCPLAGHTGAQTEGDGSFRMFAPEGQGTLVAHADTHDYPQAAGQPVTVRPGQPLGGLKLSLRRGVTVKGRVLDPGGSPVAGAEVRMALADGPGGLVKPRVTDAEGMFTWPGLPAGRDSTWTVMHRGRDLGARVLMPRPEDAKTVASLEIRLQPLGAVASRVVNEDGRPLADAVLRLRSYPPMPDGGAPVIADTLEEFSTDAEGRFRANGLLPDPGCRYALEVSAGGCVGLLSASFDVLPGRTRTLPDFVAPAARLSVSGTVVGRDGRPLADAQVKVLPKGVSKDGDSFLAPDPVVAAGDGRFVISGLAAGPVEVEAVLFVAGQELKAGEQRPTSRVRAEAGQQDVRIVIPTTADDPPTKD
jgi:RNA polymerase sigma factor (sigma-70 family)